ncbi:dipeptidase [Acidiferrimicrobium sp. IK]|uniref:dipeptidase n=1 Tax=Acidiferrimicrobium sp. IK TaxID=2871700 RepID=UPI0021CAF862|nr:dipeptidase [Acidiferrimicrobium sp. IK]MCU4184638.1 dipeptidase [Acidiferrimicrobium sp. IK]
MADLTLAAYVDEHRDRIVETLFDWLRIPSISADPERKDDVRASAAFAVEQMRAAGLEHVQLLETGTADAPGHPSVYADWLRAGPGAPTVLVYGHHDVQPVDPLEDWVSPPFTPVIVDGECKARGAIDDKGQTLYQIEAARGLLAAGGALPVNLKFLVEGEEEVGSPNFETLLHTKADLLGCDVIVVSDTGMIAPDVPSATVSMRGLVAFDVALRTAERDLHSGMWGGTVPNAARAAAELVAALHDGAGRVTIPGFYDKVRPLSPVEQASMDAQPFDEAEFKAAAAGVSALPGEDGYSPLERVGVRPTAEVVGIHSGYGGPGIKTIVPALAGFKVALRLVPDQDPESVTAAFGDWLRGHLPPGVTATVTPEGGVAPALTPVDHPAMGALARAIEKVWGAPPLYTREGGSGPEEALGRVLGAPVLFLGVGLPDDRIHAPNERMVMDQFWKGLLAAGELLLELGGTGAGGTGR